MASVQLHIYDVSTSPQIEQLNKFLTAVGTGAFHGAIEVYGKEFSYGYVQKGTGIFHNPPKKCSLHRYRESVDLGVTTMSEQEVVQLVNTMEPNWPGKDYDLLRRNCVIFSSEFAKQLGAKEVPRWVNNLAGAGASVQEGAMQAASKAQAAAIVAAAKAGEIDAQYNLKGQAAVKVADMLEAVQGLDEKYHIKDKAAETATKGGELAVKGAQAAVATAKDLDEKYHIKDKAADAASKGGVLAAKGAGIACEAGKTAVFKVGELVEKHQVKERAMAKLHDIDEKFHITDKVHTFDEKHHVMETLNKNGCQCGESCAVM